MANVICWPTQLTNMPPGVSVFFFQPFFSFYRLEFCLMKKKLTTHDVVLVTCHLTRFTFSEKLHWSTPIVETRASFFYTRWSENTLCLRHKPRRRYEMKKTRKKKTTKKIECHWKTKATFNAEWLRWTTRLGECLSLPPPFQHENPASGVNALGKRSEQKSGNTATPPLYSTHFVWTIRWFISFQIIRVVATIFRLVFSFLYTLF